MATPTKGRAARFLWPFFRPYLAPYLLLILFTIGSAAAEGGQAYLLRPLLNRVLLRGTDTAEERQDTQWIATQGALHDAEVRRALRGVRRALRQGAALVPAGGSDRGPAGDDAPSPDGAAPPGEDGEDGAGIPGAGPPAPLQASALRVFAGRAADPAWSADPVCQLLERTRRVLLDVERSLEPEEERARTEFAAAFVYQAAAEARALPDPLGASPADRAAAAALSLEARAVARNANFVSAWETLRVILLLAMGLAVILGALRYLQSVTSRTIVAKIALDLQVRVVRHTLALSAGQMRGMRRGDLLSRLNVDLARAVNGVVMPIADMLLLQPLRLLVLFVLAINLSGFLSLLLLVLGLTVLGPVRWGGLLIRRSAKDRQSALADVLEAMHQMFGGIRLVKAYRREAHERRRFREKTDRAFQAEVKVIRARTLSRTWLRLVNDVTVPLIVLAGGFLVINRWWGLDAGLFAAFAALVILMYRPTKNLAMAYNTLQDSLPSLTRLMEVFEHEPAIVDSPAARPLEGVREGIACEGVWFSYDGETFVLEDVSFEAPRGTTTAIVGHTGSGKSTLMDLLARHLDPTRGRVLVDGAPLTELELASYLSRVAVVSQSGFLFHDTVRENIRYGRLDATDAEIEEAARVARVHDEILALPGGYDYVVGEQGQMLSGGQVQRLTIARAVVRRPEVLLLDEAMSALDTRTERLVQEAIAEVSRTCTTFAIAHRLSTVRDADQILVLDGGRLVERGAHAELVALRGRYADLVAELHDAPRPLDAAPAAAGPAGASAGVLGGGSADAPAGPAPGPAA